VRGLVLALLWMANVGAHEVSESFLRIEANNGRICGSWEVAVRDLEVVIGLDANEDDQLIWDEVLFARPKLQTIVRSAIKFSTGEGAELSGIQCKGRSAGSYLALAFEGPSDGDAIQYNFMFEYDSSHRAIAVLVNGGVETIEVLTSSERILAFDKPGRFGFSGLIRQGVNHILEGMDHILFLVALLLPVVRLRSGGRNFRETLLNVLKIITAFTLAHSLTLSCAALGIMTLPSRLVESVIAFSVLLAGANIVFRWWDDRAWTLAFVFGLIHGFGFASALAELQLRRGTFLRSIVGFNLGVETGQFLIVAAVFPIAFWVREKWVYQRLVLRGGSGIIMLVAFLWILERSFSVAIFSTISTLIK
jgi:hydrogenase/urease accessory protein HupE